MEDNGVASLKWAVGVITAPRKKGYYLDKTLSSLGAAGWDSIVVFAEPNSPIPSDFTGDVVRRRKQYGDWANWATAFYELLMSEPDADYYFIAEDDGLFCRGCREYLERTMPQLGKIGTVSPYCPGRYHVPDFVGYHNECHGSLTWSTLTVIMPHSSAVSFISDPNVQRHRFVDVFANDDIIWGFDVDPKNSAKDAIIGQWAKRNGLPMYYHTPCLASHIGTDSTLSDKQTTWENLAKDFIGQEAKPNWEDFRVRKNNTCLL